MSNQAMSDSDLGEIAAHLSNGGIIKDWLSERSLDNSRVEVKRVQSRLKRWRKRSSRVDPIQHVDGAPEHYHLSGVSTLRQVKLDDGRIVQQWVKTKKDREDKISALKTALETLPEAFTVPRVKSPKIVNKDLTCVYPMGDPHIGMYAWDEDSGGKYNIKIAEQLHVAAIDELVSRAPAAANAVIVNLGDFFHSDNSSSRTLRGNNALDTDTRWSRVLRVGLRTMRRCIDKALEKHRSVRVICEIGNHDDHTAIMLALAMELLYEKNSRVTVDTSPSPFHYHRFGKTLIGVTHGGACKVADLQGIMSVDRPKDWGDTEYRMWYTGHVHHTRVTEDNGCIIEAFRTLAPNSAWAHRSGYRSGRDMRCDVWHSERGMINREIVGVEEL